MGIGYRYHSVPHNFTECKHFMNMQLKATPQQAPQTASQTTTDRRAFLSTLGALATATLSPFKSVAQSPSTVAATSVPFTAQNSADISVIHLGQGQLTFRSDNTPIPVDKNQTDRTQQPVVGPLLQISQGTFTQALAIGLDAMRKANGGQFPNGATFRLVVSYHERGGPPVEKQFPLMADRIPTERDLNKESVINGAGCCEAAYQYFRDTLCVNVAQWGTDHLQSSFALQHSRKTPARVYILMDVGLPAGGVTATNAPVQKVP